MRGQRSETQSVGLLPAVLPVHDTYVPAEGHWPPPHDWGGEGGESGGGGASGTWETGCGTVIPDHDRMVALAGPLVGWPYGDPYWSGGCICVWAYTYLFYYIDNEHFIHSQYGPTGADHRHGTVATVFEHKRLCEGTILDGRKYTYAGNWVEAKRLFRAVYVDRLLCAHWDQPNVWYTQDEIDAYYWDAPGFFEPCGFSCYFSLYSDVYLYPVPYFRGRLPVQSVITALGGVVGIGGSTMGVMSVIGGSATTVSNKRKLRRLWQ